MVSCFGFICIEISRILDKKSSYTYKSCILSQKYGFYVRRRNLQQISIKITVSSFLHHFWFQNDKKDNFRSVLIFKTYFIYNSSIRNSAQCLLKSFIEMFFTYHGNCQVLGIPIWQTVMYLKQRLCDEKLNWLWIFCVLLFRKYCHV